MQMELPRQRLARQEGGRPAIFAVAENRRADRGTMGAELMSAAGERHQGEPSRLLPDMLDGAVEGDGPLAVPLPLGIGSDPLAGPPRLLAPTQIDAAPRPLRDAAHPAPVELPALLVP